MCALGWSEYSFLDSRCSIKALFEIALDMIHALRRIADLLCTETPVLQTVDGFMPLLESIIHSNKIKYRQFNVSSLGDDDMWLCSSRVSEGLMNVLCLDFRNAILRKWQAPHSKKEMFYSAFIAFVSYKFGMYGRNPYEYAPTFGYTLHNLTNRVSNFDDIKKYVDPPDQY